VASLKYAYSQIQLPWSKELANLTFSSEWSDTFAEIIVGLISCKLHQGY
jgi:hypothetical protein